MIDDGCWGCPRPTRLPCGSDRRLHSARQIMHLAAVSLYSPTASQRLKSSQPPASPEKLDPIFLVWG